MFVKILTDQIILSACNEQNLFQTNFLDSNENNKENLFSNEMETNYNNSNKI